ncbi:MAG: hypothetical protein H5T72_09210 [Actinobacteria bacterium]|nr:hypothetical protein [Actinomycetota bacterium]
MCRRPTNAKAAIHDGTSESLVRIQILTLFHRNPGLVGTSVELAEAIGRNPVTVREQIRKLARLRILEEIEVRGEAAYRYLPPRSIVAGDEAGGSRFPETN